MNTLIIYKEWLRYKEMRILFGLTLIALIACANNTSFITKESNNITLIDTLEENIITRFIPPNLYYRNPVPKNSYAAYLSNLELHPANYKVKYYNGDIKNNLVYDAVLKIDVGTRDLQQCADAVMRLRAEYLFEQKEYSKISFRFLGDGKMHSYLAYARNDRTYGKFRKYMDYVFSYANTASLKKQLNNKFIAQANIGDVLIQSGSPYGHAITIMDMCQDSLGNKLALLAQSYMPAQEIHILKNLNNPAISPWYKLNTATIETPEWTFDSTDLRNF